MKFSVNKADFFRSLQKIVGVIPLKSTLSSLGNVLLRLENNTLSLTATDLEISINTVCKVENGVDGSTMVAGKKFYDIVRELPDQPLAIEVDENHSLKLTTDKGIYKFAGENADEFPQITAEDSDIQISFSSSKFQRMIEKTIFAVSSDEMRTTLMGVYFQVFENEIRMVATNGHRLSKISDTTYQGDSDNTIAAILSTKALQLVSKNIESHDKNIVLSVGEGHFTFSTPETQIYSKLIEGQFPNYDRVIPLDNDLQMYVNKYLLEAAVKRVSIFASQFTHLIKFVVSPSSVIIKTEDVDVGGEAQESIPVDYSGESFEIGYNAAYLLDILRHMENEDIIFHLKNSATAAIIKPSKQEDGEELMMLIMPIRLNDDV